MLADSSGLQRASPVLVVESCSTITTAGSVSPLRIGELLAKEVRFSSVNLCRGSILCVDRRVMPYAASTLIHNWELEGGTFIAGESISRNSRFYG